MVSGEKIWTMEEMQIRRVLPWNIPETPEGGATRWALSELIASLYGLWPLYIYILVGGIPTPLKNMTLSVGMMKFPIYGKIKAMFQTTNQYSIHRLYKPNYNILGGAQKLSQHCFKKIPSHSVARRMPSGPFRSLRSCRATTCHVFAFWTFNGEVFPVSSKVRPPSSSLVKDA